MESNSTKFNQIQKPFGQETMALNLASRQDSIFNQMHLG